MRLQLKNKTMTYQQQSLFDSLNLTIDEQENIQVIGLTPTEKSTFIQLMVQELQTQCQTYQVYTATKKQLFSDTEQTVSEIILSCFSDLYQLQAEIEALEEEIGFEEDGCFSDALSKQGRLQDTFSFLGGHEMDAQIEQVIQGLAIQQLLQTKASQLSTNQQQKVLLAKALLARVDLLILDDASSVLTPGELDWLQLYLTKRTSSSILFVNQLTAVTSKAYYLKNKQLLSVQ